jgi:hypothetical protein
MERVVIMRRMWIVGGKKFGPFIKMEAGFCKV